MGKEFKKKSKFVKPLAIVGTLLVWLPILAPIVLTSILLFTEGVFRLDYLMPAELFPLAFIGGGLLLWASKWVNLYRKLIAWSLGITLIALVGSQVVALITGIASGERKAVGWPLALVTFVYAIYLTAHITLGIGGFVLLRRHFRDSR